MLRYLFALLLVLLPSSVSAASRFWVPLAITNAISGTGGLCRLTVNDTSNLANGSAVVVAGIVGATACDGTTTVTTVVDSTHVEVNLAFGLAYTSGGTVAGGNWTSSGTGNWSASSGGAGGSSVPGSADSATFDSSSGGGTVIPNYNITITSLTFGAFTGTLDWSVNNNNVTLSLNGVAVSGGGSATRTFKMGNGTWTLSGAGAQWDFSGGSTNLTLNANSSTISFSSQSTTSTRSFNVAGTNALTYNNITIGDNTSSGLFNWSLTGHTVTATTVTIGQGRMRVSNGGTLSATTFTTPNSSSKPVLLSSDAQGSTATMSSASNQTLNWVVTWDLIYTGGGTWTANSSFSGGDNSGITINAPVTTTSGGIIGG